MGFLPLLYTLSCLPLTLLVAVTGAKVRRIKWRAEELAAPAVPFVIQSILMLSSLRSKSLANLIEILWGGGIAGLILLPRVIQPRWGARATAIATVAACAAAVGIYFLTPVLPE